MAETDHREKNKALEEEVWVAISAFEQILEAMPNDRASLEALSHAYGQIGDHVREREYIIRLGNVLANEGDQEASQLLAARLEPYLRDDPRAEGLATRLRDVAAGGVRLKADAGGVAAQSGSAQDARTARSRFSMADELSFAWNLLQANQLSQDEYASVVHDLTEMSASDAADTISVFHALAFRASKNLERSMGFVVQDCGSPIINLASFGFPMEAMVMLPIDFMVRRGVLVFDFIGQDALVAIMNPYNLQLRSDVESLTGRKCHFFICLPSDFDQAVSRIRALLAEKAAAEEHASAQA